MKQNLLEYLEETADRYPERVCYADKTVSMTFHEVLELVHAVGTGLAKRGCGKKTVAVMMEKGAPMASALLGVSAGGSIYCPIDTAMPKERMEIIFSVLKPAAVIAGRAQAEIAGEVLSRFLTDFSGERSGNEEACPLLLFEELAAEQPDEELLSDIRAKICPKDPLYILFTSGSTGIPKGVIGNHAMVMNELRWLKKHYPLEPSDVLGSQAPLHFVVANHDLYCPVFFGCSSFFIPAPYFTFPAKLVPLLNERRVSAVFWVPFALGMAANLRTLESDAPKFLKYIFFVGEVMPINQLNYWRRYVPDARYINLYGSTETYMCCAYEVDREFDETETLPLGEPIGDNRLFVCDENGVMLDTDHDGIGELCVCGCSVGAGYYHNPEKTEKRYRIAPVSGERFYKTGDLVRIEPDGSLIYCCRTDYQIKHLGYRIELGEIEAAAWKIPQIKSCACVYHAAKQLILFLYDGAPLERKDIVQALSERLPKYMMPNRYLYLEKLPRTANGKIDRRVLQEKYGRQDFAERRPGTA